MAITTRRENTDEHVQQIADALKEFEARHPKAQIEVYRHNSVSIRVRIIDPDFQGMDRVDRETEVWEIFDRLPDETRADLTLVLLLTPDERPQSFASMEFDHPEPSRL